MKEILSLLIKAAKKYAWPLIKKAVKAFLIKYIFGFFKKSVMIFLALVIVAVAFLAFLYVSGRFS